MPYAVDMARPNGDTPSDMLRLTVPEAAQALGISPEAVRNRLSRGTLGSTKENGTVFVLLAADIARHTANTPNDRPAGIPALVEAKDETIRVLRDQLEEEREANRENRRIIAGLVQRVPELEPAPEKRDPRETVSEDEGRGEAPLEQEKAVSWWRRLFG